MVIGNRIVERLLNYRRRCQASCIYRRVQGNREHRSAGHKQRRAEGAELKVMQNVNANANAQKGISGEHVMRIHG